MLDDRKIYSVTEVKNLLWAFQSSGTSGYSEAAGTLARAVSDFGEGDDDLSRLAYQAMIDVAINSGSAASERFNPDEFRSIALDYFDIEWRRVKMPRVRLEGQARIDFLASLEEARDKLCDGVAQKDALNTLLERWKNSDRAPLVAKDILADMTALSKPYVNTQAIEIAKEIVVKLATEHMESAPPTQAATSRNGI